ncbi:hypothetical protein Y032_0002g971 [Ancylostoma ceylanicum]|nr:hypothetical protein Y032_0002g971 [Ancylostoma ceylanicum]
MLDLWFISVFNPFSAKIVNTQRMPPQDVVGQDRAAADLSDEKILKNKPKGSFFVNSCLFSRNVVLAISLFS